MHPNDNLAKYFQNVSGPRAKYIIWMEVASESNMLSTHRLTELIFIAEGNGVLLIDNKKIPLQKGDFYIINPGVFHGEGAKNPDFHQTMQFYILGVENIFFAENKTPLYTPNNVLDSRFPFIYKELAKEAKEGSPFSEKAVQLLFKLLLTDINKLLNTQSVEPKYNTLNQLVNSVQKYIDEHFDENLTLSGISKLFFCNESTLSHNFRKHLNCSIMEYVMQQRLNCAKMWLEISNKSIADIASIAGFSTTSYFCEYFRKQVGETPLQYRKNYHIRLNALRENDENDY